MTQYGFDANSNPIRLVDSNSDTTTWAYDILDRNIRETYQDGVHDSFRGAA